MNIKIWQKLAKITAFIEASRGGENQHLKKSYVRLRDIYEALMDKIVESGLGFFIKTPTRILKVGDVELAVMDFNLVFVDAETGDFIEVHQLSMPYGKAAVNVQMPQVQDIGSIQTYGRKYAIKAFFNIADDDDEGIDKNIGAKTQQPKPQPKPVKAAQPQLADKSKEETVVSDKKLRETWFIGRYQPLASSGAGAIEIHDKFLEDLNKKQAKEGKELYTEAPDFAELVKLLHFVDANEMTKNQITKPAF